MLRRDFLKAGALVAGAACLPAWGQSAAIREVAYGQVTFPPGLAQDQWQQTLGVLLELSDDSLLKPYRQRAGLPAPGNDMGGWYDNDPAFDWQKEDWRGFAPGHCLGQWMSALARGYAIEPSRRTRARLEGLLQAYSGAISPRFYQGFRFKSYNYDKLVQGLVDAHHLAGVPNALAILEATTEAALPHLPAQALEHGSGEPVPDVSYTWDESFTLPENLFLAYQCGAGDRYRELGRRFLLDKAFFDPLAAGQNVLPGHHAYSHVNALCSAMQAWFTLGTAKHLEAARNALEMVHAQSFVTGGWGPDEFFRPPGQGELGESLTSSHRSFETPCGGYAHLKLTRYLLRATGDSRYGDSMERVLYNTVLGALPLGHGGKTFYYSDYNHQASKGYHKDKWPCCAGTLPLVTADYRLCAWLQDERGPILNLFLPSTLRWKHHRLAVTGPYPQRGEVAVEVQGDGEFDLRLRIPAWTPEARLTVNGRPHPARPGSFALLARRWSTGDRVELQLEMPVVREAVDAQHPTLQGMRVGPLALFKRGAELVPFTELAAGETYKTYWEIPPPGGGKGGSELPGGERPRS